MKKLYTLGVTTVSSVALAVSLSSPAFAQTTTYGQTATSSPTYSASSASHEHESGHENESEDNHKKGSDDNDTKTTTYQNNQNHDEDNHGSGKDDNDQKEHQDCHVKDNSGNQDNQAKYPSHPQCDKTVAKTASANTTNTGAKTGQSQPTTLPNAGAGNIALIGTLVAVAGYAVNLLRFKFLGQQ